MHQHVFQQFLILLCLLAVLLYSKKINNNLISKYFFFPLGNVDFLTYSFIDFNFIYLYSSIYNLFQNVLKTILY